MVMAIIGPLTATIPPVLLLAFTERDEVNKLSDALWVSGAFFLLGAGESYFAWRTLRVDERPRRRGISYSQNLNYLLYSDRLTFEQKKLVLGGNARRLFKLPPIAQDWGPPPMNWAQDNGRLP